MANTLDLTAYLDRVNWHGPTERTYAATPVAPVAAIAGDAGGGITPAMKRFADSIAREKKSV